jgi:PAS domain S-box-containing protein
MAKKKAAPKSNKTRVARVSKRSDGYAILNSLVGHVAIMNPAGTILFANEAWKRFARENGNPPLRAAGPGENYLELWRRAVSDGVPGARAILSGIKDVLKGKRKSFGIEYPCDLPNEQRWFDMKVAPLEGTKGGAVTSHLDITRRIRAETAAQRGDATVQALLDSATQAIVAVNRDGKLVLVNACTERMFGYTRGELLRQNLDVLVPEAKRGRHAEYHKTYFDEPQSRPMGIGLELEGRRKDGTVFPVEIGLSTVETTEGRLGVAFVTDITERKRLDALLLQRQQEVKTLLDNSPDAIMRVDREIRYRYVNSTSAKVTGLAPEAFLGKTPRQLGLPENLCDLWTRVIGSVFESGLPQVIEFSYPSAGNGTIWEQRVLPEFDPDGTVRSALIIARDITERKRLEKATETHGAELRALAARLLTVAEEERRRVSRELHDNLVQQLASLAFDVGGLVAELPPRNRARIRLQALQARVVKVSEEARHIAYELHPSVVDDLGLAISLKALCEEFAREQDIIVEFKQDSLARPIPQEVASGLYRIAQESLRNIANHAHAKHVTVQLVRREQVVRLSIEDDGVGFDPTAVKGKGGLGLVGNEERARLLGARCSLASKPGHGTRIALTVPLLQKLQ